MKVFKITGWCQYKTDCATEVERVQIARNEVEAIAIVRASLKPLARKDSEYEFILRAQEIL